MRKILSLSLSLSLLAGLTFFALWGAKRGFNFIRDALRDMDPDTRAATIAAFAVVMVPAVTFATQLYMEKRRSREQAMREKRTEFYGSVIAIFISMPNSYKQSPSSVTNGVPAVTSYVGDLEKLTPNMILYGSRGFVKAWNKLRHISAEYSVMQGDTGVVRKEKIHLMLAAMEVMLLEARKDLGHRVTEKDRSEYVSTFVNDVDKELLKRSHKKLSEVK